MGREGGRMVVEIVWSVGLRGKGRVGVVVVV